jgi:DNA-binding transcriptional regulator YiaG
LPSKKPDPQKEPKVTSRKEFPVDEPNPPLDEADWVNAENAMDKHRVRLAGNPVFEAALEEITQRQSTLREVRLALSLTQQTVADAMQMSQSELSRLERRDDLMWSTLGRFVEATGGELHLIATYPGRPPVELKRQQFFAAESDKAEQTQEA